MSAFKKPFTICFLIFLNILISGCAMNETTNLPEVSDYQLENSDEIVFNLIEIYKEDIDSLVNIEPNLSIDQKKSLSEALLTMELLDPQGRPESSKVFANVSFSDNEGWLRNFSIFQQEDAYYMNFPENPATYYKISKKDFIQIVEEKIK